MVEDGDEVIKPSVVTVKVIIKLTFTYTDVTFKYQFKVKETLSEPEQMSSTFSPVGSSRSRHSLQWNQFHGTLRKVTCTVLGSEMENQLQVLHVWLLYFNYCFDAVNI